MPVEDDTLLDDYFSSLSPTWVADADASPPTRRYVTVVTTQLYNDPLLGKPRGVRFEQGLDADIRLPLTSAQTGAPVVIAIGGYSVAPTIGVRIVESTGVDKRIWAPDAAAELVDDGRAVTFAVPQEVADCPGVYRAQVRVVDGGGVERLRDEVSIWVDRGLWTRSGDVPVDYGGPPAFSDIRTALRDHPVANRLLGDYEFDSVEIGYAVVSAVQQFNTGFPPLPTCYAFSTRTFPALWRRQLLTGALAFLFETAATYFRRGSLPYQASGVSINDLAKDKDYQAVVESLRAQYAQWIKTTRMSVSVGAAWGSLGSGATTGGSIY